MTTTFTLSITFSLRDGKEIRYEGEWSGERRWDLPKDWVELRVSPIEMAQEETPDDLADLLIENFGRGPFYDHKPLLNEKSDIIKKIKQIPSMDEIAGITVQSSLDDGNGKRNEQLFEYTSDTKLMTGTHKGDDFLLGDRFGDLTFREAVILALPRYAQADGTFKGIFLNETEEEKYQRLYREFNEKMEALDKEYGNAKDAYLANLKRFPSYPDVEQAKQFMDYNAKIEFPDKYIMVYGCPEAEVLSKEIEKRGAFYRDRAIKKADYFVLWDPDDVDGRHHSAIEKMLGFRERGGEAVFVTAYQLWKSLSDGKTSSMSEEELEILNLEREEKKILDEMEKIRGKIAEEKEKLEAKILKEKEKQRKKAEKEQAKSPKKAPAKNTGPAPEKEPVKQTAKKEDPLTGILRSAAESNGLTLDDLYNIIGVDDDNIDLSDLDLDDEDEEGDETEKQLDSELISELEDAVKNLERAYAGKPRFASYTAMKNEIPSYNWDYLQFIIKNSVHSTPATYFREKTSLIKAGPNKNLPIGTDKAEAPKAAPAKAPAKKEPVKKAAPEKAPAAKPAPAPKVPAPKPALAPAPKPVPAPVLKPAPAPKPTSIPTVDRAAEERQRQAAEQARQEEISRKQAEAEKNRNEIQQSLDRTANTLQKMTDILEQIVSLEKERDQARGLFAAFRRNRINRQIEELKRQLENI